MGTKRPVRTRLIATGLVNFCLTLHAQVLTPILSFPFAYQGSTLNLAINFADSIPSAGIAGLQWSVTAPPGFTFGTPVLGAASIAAGKSINCNNGTCIVSATNTTTFQNGLVATLPVTVTAAAATGPWTVGLSGLVATSATGIGVPITFPGADASIILPVSVNPPGVTTRWFTFTVGNNVCWVDKVPQVPMKVTYSCSNPYGYESGSYTADPNNGGNAGNLFMLRSGSTDASLSSLTCQIAINATAQALVIGGLGSIAPTSARYQCSGGGTSLVSWP